MLRRVNKRDMQDATRSKDVHNHRHKIQNNQVDAKALRVLELL